ncbi:MAG TPA: TonB family protein [Pyrinomonadaceae bacterium]
MKKACQVCGFRNPAAGQNCVMCGAALPASTGVLVGAGCCPAPGCVELAVPAPARYCPLCGAGLKPISCDLWAMKFVEPALERSFVATLQDPSGLLREAAEMGLSEEEAEARLDAAFVARAGATRGVLQQWESEYVKAHGAGNGARSASLARADELKIDRGHAELILEASAPDHDAPAEPAVVEPLAHAPTETALPFAAPPETEVAARPLKNEAPAWMTIPFAEEVLEEEPVDSSGRRRLVLLGASLLCVALLLTLWLVFRRPAPNTGRTRNSNVTPVNSTPTVNETPHVVETPVVESTPEVAAEVKASPTASPTVEPDDAEAEVSADSPAVLVLLTNADGVTVWINGQRRGVISKGSPASFKLAPGTQSVVAEAEGFEQYEKSFSVEAAEKRNLFVTMRPLSGPTPLARERARQRLLAGQLRFQRRDYQGALAEANEGLRLDPGNEELLRLRRNVEWTIAELTRASSQPTPTPRPPAVRPRREPTPESTPTPRYVPRAPPETYEGARMTRKVQPVYPIVARNARVGGTVVVEVTVDEWGRATEARAVSGHMLLQRAAVEAAMRSSYSPARRNGRQVNSTLSVNFVFKLE